MPKTSLKEVYFLHWFCTYISNYCNSPLLIHTSARKSIWTFKYFQHFGLSLNDSIFSHHRWATSSLALRGAVKSSKNLQISINFTLFIIFLLYIDIKTWENLCWFYTLTYIESNSVNLHVTGVPNNCSLSSSVNSIQISEGRQKQGRVWPALIYPFTHFWLHRGDQVSRFVQDRTAFLALIPRPT